MMVGVFVIAGGYYVAQRLEFYVISWAIRNLLASLVFVILVIFHKRATGTYFLANSGMLYLYL
jgi:DNA integrity scanning protein DisA with diadenylate cyclase activity